MTGFASLDTEVAGTRVGLEARSVNHRGLDVRTRLPSGFEAADARLRKAISGTFKRGSVTVSMSLRRVSEAQRFTVNREQLAVYIDEIQAMAASGAVAAPRADGLLALKGVVEATQEDDTELAAEALDGLFSELLAALADNRAEEGARLAPVIAGHLDEMDRLRSAIEESPERELPAIKARLHGQIAALLDGAGLTEERLHQEAALLATRADIREELDRLSAHIEAARQLLAAGGPMGRKLDFLSQELNRETNTICSKAPHHTITALGLELKSVVEQFREQVQNLE
ncbi:MAG: YicC/YloC family endoribonuclease [Pseudomonadota bacterium]